MPNHTMMTSAEIRQTFLDFFKSKGHTIVPSAPIVIKNDPTLLFTNAGMNQFKDYFLGNKPAPYPRAVDTQKCLRVSGKHNDLEEVGVDTYHHTMFEMLGNWSFGDYFKTDAIAWSWELLTEVYKIPVDRLYVTVFEGDAKENLPPSSTALAEWKKIVAEDHIVFGNKKDNFWEMGDTGPCGPCSEIHVDMRSEEERLLVPGRDLINKDHPQVIEIWNNVFMQFNRLKDGSLQTLPAQHVDTGMGFERLVRVIQGKTSNYDTDVFTGTIAEVEKLSGKTYQASPNPSEGGALDPTYLEFNPKNHGFKAPPSEGFGEANKSDIAFRVIADHIRAICFCIADGQLPSNTGAGYVIRRILRRAVRYAYSYLDVKEPMLCKLVPVLAKQFENVFPELFAQTDFVSKVVMEEENGFLRTLEGGLKRMDELMKQSDKIINGDKAFELFDTYGFPIDLTTLIASENNLSIDEEGFKAALLQQKNRSRAATSIDAGDWIVFDEEATNKFVGYNSTETQTKLVKYRKVTAKGQEGYQLVLETTPFYAESGGQVGDTGKLIFGNEELVITNTKKDNDLIIHFTDRMPSDPEASVLAKVDSSKRQFTSVHHSATHLLHAALRSVLGTHVAQKGSLVNADQLRFDFSHFSKVTDEEVAAIEKIVNEKIRQNIPVVINELPKEEALKLGAMALFGEKYGDMVRVVIMDPSYSVELCGGTHVGTTGELGFFKIKHETAVAAGVRRIEAVSGNAAETYVNAQLHELHAAKLLLKNPKEFAKSIEQLQQENSDLKKQFERLEARQLIGIRNELIGKTVLLNGTAFIGDIIEVSNGDALKKICTDLKNELSAPYAVVLCANIGGKASVAVMYDEANILDAGKTIKEHIAPLIKGGGGGSKSLATAGGQEVGNLAAVIEKVKELL
jgi:alanyl-tRNA synthetase